jgi:hypothetical protein
MMNRQLCDKSRLKAVGLKWGGCCGIVVADAAEEAA